MITLQQFRSRLLTEAQLDTSLSEEDFSLGSLYTEFCRQYPNATEGDIGFAANAFAHGYAQKVYTSSLEDASQRVAERIRKSSVPVGPY